MATKTIRQASETTPEQVMERVIVSGSLDHEDLEDIGQRLGIYDAMTEFGPVTSAELAEYTGISEQAICAWLGAQMAEEFVTYDVHTGRYSLWATWPPLR